MNYVRAMEYPTMGYRPEYHEHWSGFAYKPEYNVMRYSGLGADPDSITTSDIVYALKQRGYVAATVSPTPTPTPTPTPSTLSKSAAINCGVNASLIYYNMNRSCIAAQCAVEQTKFNSVVTYALSMARYYATKTSCPSSFQGLGYFGQEGDPSWWDKYGGALLSAIGAAVSSAGQFVTAKQIQQNVQNISKLQNIPPPSQDQLNALIAAAIQQNPGSAGAIAQGTTGAFGPDWLKYAMVGLGAVVLVMLVKK